jgi:signal transduction histidine kinase/ABC-type amino acid transport substrate-binding protein
MIGQRCEILPRGLRFIVLGGALVLGLASYVLPTKAEEEPVVHGWAQVLPAVRVGEGGQPEGFSLDLAGRIAELAGFNLSLKRFDSVPAWIQGQAEGEADMLSGAAELPGLRATNLFSKPVATTRVRLFVRVEDANRVDLADFVNRKIGTVPPVAGSEPSPLLERNVNVTLPSLGTALIRLLSGDIDGVLLPEEAMLAEAHAAGLDHRIAATGPTVRAFDRVVAIHKRHAKLLERVNSAIDELQASGELAEMRWRWFLEAPPPPPETLTVGVNHFPPYNIVREDGSFTGFSVETIRDLAELAGLKLEFKQITPEEWRQGPGPGRYDIITQAGISAERKERMDFTLPVERFPFSIFVRKNEAFEIAGLDDLFGRRVGVEKVNLARRLAEKHGGLDLTILDGQDALISALLNHKVDAILYPTKATRDLIRRQRFEDRIEEIKPPFFISNRAPALRFGLGEVRQRLNAVIPGYLISESHTVLVAEWLDDRASYWTRERVRLLIVIGIALILLFLTMLLYTLLRRRHQIARERRRFAGEIAEHIPIGLLLISPEGNIDFANREIKDRTPGGSEQFKEGQSYRAAIKSLIDQGKVETQGRSPAKMLKMMTEDGLADGYSREFQLAGEGSVFLRTTKRLRSGSALIIRQDVTDYKRSQRQIEALNADLKEQIRLAEITNNELRAFAYATSHDLKAPTNTLILSLDALAEDLKGRLRTDEADLIAVAKRTVSGMRALIDGILAYTNTIGSVPDPEPVDLNKVASDVLEALHADIEVNAAEIKLNQLPSLKANPTQMYQLVQNLISNAVKFHHASQAPVVDIEATDAPPGYVAFKVKDNGIGIAPGQQGEVFELFTRLNRRSTYGGSGLGLAICQRIVLNHGGRIDLQSTPGEGSCFTVLLKEKGR